MIILIYDYWEQKKIIFKYFRKHLIKTVSHFEINQLIWIYLYRKFLENCNLSFYNWLLYLGLTFLLLLI